MIEQAALSAAIFGTGPAGLHMHSAWAAAPSTGQHPKLSLSDEIQICQRPIIP